MSSKIYTKGGDLGETSLLGGQRVSKSNIQLEAYGTVDELNSSIGVCLTLITDKRLQQMASLPDLTQIASLPDLTQMASLPDLTQMAGTLRFVQNELFNIGSHLACEDKKLLGRLPPISEKLVSHLESQIDEMTAALPVLKEFVLPGGHPTSAALHVARTICRRAERRAISFAETAGGDSADADGCADADGSADADNVGRLADTASPAIKQIIICLNRLSDYLFVAARYTNHVFGADEIKWIK